MPSRNLELIKHGMRQNEFYRIESFSLAKENEEDFSGKAIRKTRQSKTNF